MTDYFTIPATDVAIALDAKALLNPYGHVTGMAYDNGAPHLTLRLHDGTRLILEREGADWILGLAEGHDIRTATALHGPDGQFHESVREAINELWRVACSVVDQLVASVVDAVDDDLARLLDRAMTEPPF